MIITDPWLSRRPQTMMRADTLLQTLEDCLTISRLVESRSLDLESKTDLQRLQLRLTFLIRSHPLASEARALECLESQVELTRQLTQRQRPYGGQ